MTFGSKKLSPETIEKMREKALNRPAMSAPWLPSPRRGNFDFVNQRSTEGREHHLSLPEGSRAWSEVETKKKCISHTRPVVLYNLNGTVYGEYSTILEAANSINCGEKTLRRALKTEKGLVKRQWIVKYLSSK
jgi:hypothetical protein